MLVGITEFLGGVTYNDSISLVFYFIKWNSQEFSC